MAEHKRQQREDRVLGFFSSHPNELGPPSSHPQASVYPLRFRGGGDTLACGRVGAMGVTNRIRGQTLWYFRYTCTLWAKIKTIYSRCWFHLGSILLVTYFMPERVGEKEPIELGGGGGRGGRMSEISAVYDQS